MFKNKLFLLFALQCGLILLSLSYRNQSQTVHSQTVPTATPIPQPATDTPIPPTNTPDSNGNGNNTPTNTPQAGSTATSTLIPASTLAPTPVDGYLPTAAPCDDSPTIQAFNNLNIRQGPGTDYEIMGRMVFLEVRPIIGRSQFEQWWLISLPDGSSGWVADSIGLSQGYIGNVPVVPAPAINDQTPTPGTPWQPTPRASCTVTPTYTPSPTPTETATPTASATATAVPPTATLTATPESSSNETDTTTPESVSNEADAATRIASQVVAENPTIAPTAYPSQPTAIPLAEDTPTNTPNILPIVGLIFVAGGIFAVIARRQFSKQ